MQVSLWLVVAPSADLRSLTAGAKARETLSAAVSRHVFAPRFYVNVSL